MKIKLVVFAPVTHTDIVRKALGKAGAGQIGDYTFCSFSVVGKGRFIPSDNTNPYVGNADNLEVVEEERIEVICDRSDAKTIIAAMRQAHPYEEVAFDIYTLLDESEL